MSIANQIVPKPNGIAARAMAAMPAGGLMKYEAACRAIAEAKSVDEVKAIRDTADALRAAARIAGNRQGEIDMAEIRIRGERRLGELMAAQRETVGFSQGGRPAEKTGSQADPVSAPITLAEAGIDKHLADRARKYAAIPETEFEEILTERRERFQQEDQRVTIDLLKAGERAETGRRENDFYPSPDSLIAEVVRRWKPTAKTVWEPCAGDGRVAQALRDSGYDVVIGDISQGNDFFACQAPPSPGAALCTNPPFGRVREFIDHAFAIGVREMCLVLPERLWACGAGREQFERHRPSVWANMDWREDYLGKGGSPDRALAVAIWHTPNSIGCIFDVWTRGDEGSEAFNPETGEIIDPSGESRERQKPALQVRKPVAPLPDGASNGPAGTAATDLNARKGGSDAKSAARSDLEDDLINGAGENATHEHDRSEQKQGRSGRPIAISPAPRNGDGSEPTGSDAPTGSARNTIPELIQNEAPKQRPEAAAKSAAHIDTPAAGKSFVQGSSEADGPGGMQDECAIHPATQPQPPVPLPAAQPETASLLPAVSGTNATPAFLAGDDGHPSIPTTDALAAGAGEQSPGIDTKSVGAVTINERCLKPATCKFGAHPNKITCAGCNAAWAAQKAVAA